MTTHHQFVTTDVLSACNQARIAYLEMLWQAQSTMPSVADLAAEQQKCRTLLDGGWDLALQAALLADLVSATQTFVSIVKAWGRYKALDDLIIAMNATGVPFDPSSPEVSEAFEEALETRLVLWSTELHNQWTEGRRGAWDMVHQQNQEYANLALRSTQQAQQGIRWMQEGVERMHQQAGQQVQWMQQGVQEMYCHVQSGLTANQQALAATAAHLEQNLPREVRKAQMRGCLLKSGIIIAAILAVLVAFPLGFLYLTVVVLHH